MRLVTTALLLALPTAAFAQQTPATIHASKEPSAQQPEPDRATDLPVTHVSLYKNGVGFFEHTGHVTGNAAVNLSFTSAQLNDVLQSLTAIDLNGGRISGAGYNSTTPLDQQLKSLSLGLGEETTFSGLFTALHGTRVSVSGSGAPFTGRIVDIEMHKTGPGKDATGMLEGRFLTVASDSGEVRIFQVTPALSVRLLDTSTHTDLNRYLELLDSTRNQGLRHLTLDDHGTGTRELHVSYISEVPIWKSTYRILFTDSATPDAKQTATLQGWSVVDNTTGTDWLNVQLSLIAGAPQSFVQPLSQPIYSRRIEIPIAQEAQLTPQTHDSSINGSAESLNTLSSRPAPGYSAKSAPRQVNGMAVGNPVGVAGGMVSGRALSMGGPLSADKVESFQEAATASLTPFTQTAAFDDFFAYNLTEPVTIRKNESALVPILQAKIPAESVTLISSNGNNTSQPLRALWITNTTNLTLDRGSFSLVEDGAFGGEGLLDPIHPAEKRLLSYAADQAVHVTTESNKNSSHVDEVTAAKGVLVLHRADVSEITYVIHNAAPVSRAIVLEHPVRFGYTLDSDPKPEETTPTVYRFRVHAAPGETVRLHVGAKHRGTTQYQLTNYSEDQLALIVRESGDSSNIQAALAPILDARRRVSDAQVAVDQTNATLNGLREDEERQRANITALQSADKSSRDRFVHDLNKTEDAITAAQTELTTRTTALNATKADLANRIEALQIDEKL